MECYLDYRREDEKYIVLRKIGKGRVNKFGMIFIEVIWGCEKYFVLQIIGVGRGEKMLQYLRGG